MPQKIPLKDSLWFKQIAEGNEEAFRFLFDAYWDHIYSVAFLLVKSEALAEDVVQDVFLKIWANRERLTAVEKFEDYLFIVARNHVYDILKKQKKEDHLRASLIEWFESNRETPEQQLLLKESGQLLQQAVARLSPAQQAVYKMVREQGLSHKEVAEQLNISPNTVRNHIVNSLKIIREHLDQHASPVLLFISLLNSLR